MRRTLLRSLMIAIVSIIPFSAMAETSSQVMVREDPVTLPVDPTGVGVDVGVPGGDASVGVGLPDENLVQVQVDPAGHRYYGRPYRYYYSRPYYGYGYHYYGGYRPYYNGGYYPYYTYYEHYNYNWGW